MTLRALLLGCVALCITACVSSEVSRVSEAKYASRPKGCPVKVFPATTPEYNWDDIASVKARCHFTQGRDACIAELRDQACSLGGDTVYGFTDGVQGEYTIVIGTVAISKPGTHAKSGETPPKPPVVAAEVDGCTPPCSPGYACQNSQCIALCNPPCPSGSRCNQQRVCESMAPATPAPAASSPLPAP
jgi:hypothetical protein